MNTYLFEGIFSDGRDACIIDVEARDDETAYRKASLCVKQIDEVNFGCDENAKVSLNCLTTLKPIPEVLDNGLLRRDALLAELRGESTYLVDHGFALIW